MRSAVAGIGVLCAEGVGLRDKFNGASSLLPVADAKLLKLGMLIDGSREVW